MKLLTISHACVTSINQQFFSELEKQTGWELMIVTPSNWKNDYSNHIQPERWKGYKGGLVSIPVWKPGNIPLHVYQTTFMALLRQFQPDFIYVQHEPYAAATIQVYLANCLSIKKPIGFFTWQNIAKSYPFPFRQTEQWVLQQSQCVFPGSRSAEVVLQQKGYTGKGVILPPGIDPSIYYPRPEAKALKNKLCANSDQVLIGYMGRIVEEKGLKTLLYALQQLQELPWRLVMVGSGSYEAEFDELFQSLNLSQRVQRLGYVAHTEAPVYLSAFDILALPSETRPHWKEQFGRVTIEALACGTPVVGSDSGEIPHLLEATGGGLVFSEGRPEALAERLRQLVVDSALRSRLVEQGRKIVLERYTSTPTVLSFAQAIEQVVRQPTNNQTDAAALRS